MHVRPHRLFAMIGTLALTTLAAEAALVNTTFEADSAGPSSWTVDTAWGDPANKDLASGIAWTSSGEGAVVTSSTAASGSQAGQLTGGTTRIATLEFGNSSSTGHFTVTLTIQHTLGDAAGNDFTTTYLRDASGNDIVQLRLEYNGSSQVGTVKVRHSGGDTVLLNSYSPGTWYEFEVVLDTTTQKFDARVRALGDTTWAGEATNLAFRSSAANNFAIIRAAYTGDDGSGYWDDIRVVPEPATVGLLSIGLLLAVHPGRVRE